MTSPHRINNGSPQTVKLPGNGSASLPKSTIVTVDGKKFKVTTVDNDGNALPIPPSAQEKIKTEAKKLIAETGSSRAGKNKTLNFDSTGVNGKKYKSETQEQAFKNIQLELNDFEVDLEDEDTFNVPARKEKKSRTQPAQNTPPLPKKPVKPKKPNDAKAAANPHKVKAVKPAQKKANSDGDITSEASSSSSSTESSSESSSYRESSSSIESSEYFFLESIASEDASTESSVVKKTKKKSKKTKTSPKKKKTPDLDIKTLQPNVATKVAEYFSAPRQRTRLERISDLFSKIKNLPLRLFGCGRQKDERLPKLPPHWTLNDAVTALNKLEQSRPQLPRNIERYAQAKKQLTQRFVKEALKEISTQKKKEKKENKDNEKTWFENLALPLFENCQNFEARKQLAQKYPDLISAALNNKNFSDQDAIDIMAQLSPEQQFKLLIKNMDIESEDFNKLLPAAILTLSNVDGEKLHNLLEIFDNYEDADKVVTEFLELLNQYDSNKSQALSTKIKIYRSESEEALSDVEKELLTLKDENNLDLVKNTLTNIFSNDEDDEANELKKTTAALMLPVTILEQILNESPPLLAEMIRIIPYMTHPQLEAVILHSNESDLVQAAFSRLHSQKSPLSKNLQDDHLNNFNLLLAKDLKKKIVAAINALPKDSDAIDKEDALNCDFKQKIVDYLKEHSGSEDAIKNLIDQTNSFLESLQGEKATYDSFIKFLERTDSSSSVSESTSEQSTSDTGSTTGSTTESSTETDNDSSKD